MVDTAKGELMPPTYCLIEADPDKAAEPQWGWLIASQFFSSRGCTAKAEAGDFEGVCRTINGGDNGLDDRRTRYAKALAALA